MSGTSDRGARIDVARRRVGVPPLILCPRCEGQLYDRESCALCGNVGYLREVDGGRLSHAEQVQILATFAIAAGLQVTAS